MAIELDPRTSAAPTRRGSTFVVRRAHTVERLVRAGLSRQHADAWIAAWLESTAGLKDFRAADDYWDMGFHYAIEERRRGYTPPGLPD
jgi:hypothetical protein